MKDEPQVTAMLADAVRRFRTADDVETALKTAREELVGHAQEVWIPPPEPLPNVVQDALALLRQSYTIDAERRTHDRLFAPCGGIGQQSLDQAGEEDLDALFF